MCLCLSAAVNVLRRADCLRLSVTCLLSPCEPAFRCYMAFYCALHQQHVSLFPYLHHLRQTWIWSIHLMLPDPSQARLCHVCVLLCRQLPLIEIQVWTVIAFRSLSPSRDCHRLWRCICFPLVYFHMCVPFSFVSCLLGSKSWEHNGPCLGLDNSHYEWVWEREEGAAERDRKGLQEALFTADCHFLGMCLISQSLLLSIYLPSERTQGDHQLLCYSSRCKVATEQL